MRKKSLVTLVVSSAAISAIYKLFSANESDKKIHRAVSSQNSGLFTSYTYFFRNSIILEDKKLEKTVLIKQPFWLDEVDESRLDTPWGQNFREYPPVIQQKILKLFPQVEKQDRLTFGQMKKLREYITLELKQSQTFDVIEGECVDIKLGRNIIEKFPLNEEHLFPFYPYRHRWEYLEKGDFNLASSDKNIEISTHIEFITKDNKIHPYQINDDLRLYNFTIEPRPNPAIKELNNGKDLPTQTELYKYKRGHEPKRIIVFGSGLSAVWVCEQAPDSDVHIVMTNKNSRLPPEIKRNEKTKINSNQLLYSNETDFLLIKQCWDKSENETNLHENRKKSLAVYANLHGINLENERENENFIVAFLKDNDKILAVGVGYNAIGFIPNKTIGKSLPDSMVEHLHFDPKELFYGPKNLPGGALFDRHNEQLRHIMKSDDPLEFIDIEALFIRQKDKPYLAKKLGVDGRFIDDLCEEIKKLEDTPENSKEFIKQYFVLWQQKEDTTTNEQTIVNFNEKIEQLFKERSLHYSEPSQLKNLQPR